MRNEIILKLAFFFLVIVVVFFPFQINAEDIVGDVNDNGVVGLEEAIYALQVAAGMTPAVVMNPDLGPRYTAWGTYTYLPESGDITLNFTFSNFPRSRVRGGPGIGDIVSVKVEEFSSTTMTIRTPKNILETWFREKGTAGDIVGRWIRNDTHNNTFVIIFDSNGSMLYTAYGDYFSKTVNVPNNTISIDGNFSDWTTATPLDIYMDSGDCGNVSGREIREVYVAQDDNYIYLRMKLNGPPDPTFRYKFGDWFHIRVTPPPSTGIIIASSVCGATLQNGLVEFGNSEDGTLNQFEGRFDKCIVDQWNIDELFAWSDQDSVTICEQSVDFPILKFDFSMCE